MTWSCVSSSCLLHRGPALFCYPRGALSVVLLGVGTDRPGPDTHGDFCVSPATPCKCHAETALCSPPLWAAALGTRSQAPEGRSHMWGRHSFLGTLDSSQDQYAGAHELVRHRGEHGASSRPCLPIARTTPSLQPSAQGPDGHQTLRQRTRGHVPAWLCH